MTAPVEKSSIGSRVSQVITVPAISIIFALILSIFILIIMGQDPILALKSMTLDIFFSQDTENIDLKPFANVFFYSTPLILTGLSVAVAFRAGMFNIGTEGQVIMGGFLSALVGSALAGAAGILISFETNIQPTMGFSALLKGIIASIIGGIGSIPGAVLGGFFLGLAENLGIWKISAGWKDCIAFVILIIFLLIRPWGFLGTKTEKETI